MNDDFKISIVTEKEKGAVLKVIGVGGGGGNAINRMIENGLSGVEFFAVNTDIQDLADVKSPAVTLQIGEKITKGLGAGSNHEIGVQAALENNESIIDMLDGANMVFITAGMGGGTGTGASQVIANHASSAGILTVAVITKPFEFEGDTRMKVAEEGIKNLMGVVDALIVIPNEKLFELDEGLSLKNAYATADDILLKAVKGISDIINNPGYQNVDFADVQTAMSEKGMTLMGTGESTGEDRAEDAAKKALRSPLLDDITIDGATGILYNITASSSLGLKEVKVVADIIRANAAKDARIKFGVVEDETMDDRINITIIATGFKDAKRRIKANRFTNRTLLSEQIKKDSEKMNERPQVSETSKIEEKPFDRQKQYVFDSEKKPFNISEISENYVNDPVSANMSNNPENIEDSNQYLSFSDEEDEFLEVPVFQRTKLTEID